MYGPVTSQAIPKNGFYLTDIIDGSQATIYLIEPTNHKDSSSITIRRVVHGFTNVSTFETNSTINRSANCHTDVMCEPEYSEESNAVAVVLTTISTAFSRTTLRRISAQLHIALGII